MLSVVRLTVAWATLFVIGTDLFVVSPLIPIISGDYHVRAENVGLVVTAFALGYVFAAPVWGHLADRAGRRRVLTGCLVGFAAANLMTAAAPTLPAMMAARLLCGIAAAGVTPSIYALVGNASPIGHRGTWIAIVLTGLLSSLPLGTSIGVVASLSMGWPIVFAGLAGCSLVFALAHRGIWPDDRHGASRPGLQSGAISAVGLMWALTPTVAWSTALYGMYTYLGAGLTGLDYQPNTIAQIIFVYGVAGFAGALLGGRMADRLGPLVTVKLSLAGTCVCFVLLWLAIHAGIWVEAAFALMSVMAQTFFPAQQSLLLSRFPARLSTALSCNNSALFLGIAIGSIIGGQAMAEGGFTAILPISAAAVAVGFAGLCWQRLVSSSPAAIGPAT